MSVKKEIYLYVDGKIKSSRLFFNNHDIDRFFMGVGFDYRNHGGEVEVRIRSEKFERALKESKVKQRLEYKGELWDMYKLAKYFKVSYSLLYYYIFKKKLSLEETIKLKQWKEQTI